MAVKFKVGEEVILLKDWLTFVEFKKGGSYVIEQISNKPLADNQYYYYGGSNVGLQGCPENILELKCVHDSPLMKVLKE